MNLARSEAVASSVYVADQSLRMKENLPGRAKSQNCQFELVVCSVAFPTARNLPLSILLQSLMSVSCLLVFSPLQLYHFQRPSTLPSNVLSSAMLHRCLATVLPTATIPSLSWSNEFVHRKGRVSNSVAFFFVSVFFFFVVAKWWGLVASFAKGFFDWNWGAVEVVYWNSGVVVC